MELRELKIGGFTVKYPIIQGGMSVRTSMAPLAAAVTNAGGIGIIGGSGISLQELKDEIKKCKSMTDGVVGVNIMYAINDFADMVRGSIEAGADIIFTGAGFSKDVFRMVKNTRAAVVSIVSSVKAAVLAERLGADAVVVEGAEAGGHLGTDKPLAEILPEIIERVKTIPVIAAGGIIDGFDIAKYLKMGVKAVQMASRFVCSDECSASDDYKQAYIKSKKEDIVTITSPVGYPGRAIKNKLVEKIEDGSVVFDGCPINCLKTCSHYYCINQKLNNGMQKGGNGNIDDALIFSGAESWRIKEILPAKKIIENLVNEVTSVEE